MAEECCASNGNVMILACSGGSNVGQLANRAARFAARRKTVNPLLRGMNEGTRRSLLWVKVKWEEKVASS
jgi:uncharacterized metal-binding protein